MKTNYKLIAVTLVLFLSMSMKGQTAGTFSFTVNQTTHTSTYEGTKRCLAIWIEYNSTGTTWTFVKSLLVRGKNTQSNHLPTWNTAAGGNTTGLTTTSTLASMASTTVTWDGKNVSGVLVADGNYRVAVQETWNHGTSGTATKYITFTKGPTDIPSTTVTADTNFTGMSYSWTAVPLAIADITLHPNVVVYPNPSNGVVNLNFKNEVKNIKIVNMLGDTIYNENTSSDDNAKASKRIDLSSYANGEYIINVTNDNGTSTYKVLLAK